MKNIQIIDGALNCTYDIYAAEDEEFAQIFPEGTDVAFIEEFVERVGEELGGQILTPVWSRRLDKKRVNGIHGTLFFELLHKSKYYPTRKEGEFVALPDE